MTVLTSNIIITVDLIYCKQCHSMFVTLPSTVRSNRYLQLTMIITEINFIYSLLSPPYFSATPFPALLPHSCTTSHYTPHHLYTHSSHLSSPTTHTHTPHITLTHSSPLSLTHSSPLSYTLSFPSPQPAHGSMEGHPLSSWCLQVNLHMGQTIRYRRGTCPYLRTHYFILLSVLIGLH